MASRARRPTGGVVVDLPIFAAMSAHWWTTGRPAGRCRPPKPAPSTIT